MPPDISPAQRLNQIEDRLEDAHLGPDTRRELERLRAKALSGKLTQREIDEFRRHSATRTDSITAVAASFRAARRRLAALPDVSAVLIEEIDRFLDHLKSASGAVARASVLGKPHRIRLAAFPVPQSTRVDSGDSRRDRAD